MVSLIGGAASLSLIWVPDAEVGPAATVLVVALILLGAAGPVSALVFLGARVQRTARARPLVTRRSYRLIAHPRLAAELTMMAGAAILLVQPEAALIFAAVVGVTIARIQFEEEVVTKLAARSRLHPAPFRAPLLREAPLRRHRPVLM
jgi:protein-S-isoprenylcysteine O-methyltransferase Ste14